VIPSFLPETNVVWGHSALDAESRCLAVAAKLALSAAEGATLSFLRKQESKIKSHCEACLLGRSNLNIV